jgi:hypothetical protein
VRGESRRVAGDVGIAAVVLSAIPTVVVRDRQSGLVMVIDLASWDETRQDLVVPRGDRRTPVPETPATRVRRVVREVVGGRA